MSPTTESQEEESSLVANDANLMQVLQKINDSVYILHDLAKRTNLPEIQQYADRQIAQRQAFTQELSSDLSSVSNAPADGTVQGLLRRLSKDLKSLLPNAEYKMLEEVENGETSLRATYLRVLEQNSASPALRDKLHRQQAHVARAQSELRSLLAHTRPGFTSH